MSTDTVYLPDPQGAVTTYYSEILTEVDMSGLKVNSATKITRFEGSSEASSPRRKVLVWYLDHS